MKERSFVKPMTPAEYVAIDAGKICGCPSCRERADQVIKNNPSIAPSAVRLSLQSATEDFKFWQKVVMEKRRKNGRAPK